MINFPLINFLSLSSNLSSNQNYLQEHERKKKKRKGTGIVRSTKSLMEAYPSRYDRSFNFLSGSGANISPLPPAPAQKARGYLMRSMRGKKRKSLQGSNVGTVFKVFLESSTGNGAFIRKYSISLYLRFTLSLAPFNPQQDSSISLRPISPLNGPPLSASFCHS